MRSSGIILCLLALCIQLNAQTFTNAKTGVWSSATTWKGGKVPASNVAVIVSTGTTLTIDKDVLVKGITVSSGAALVFSSKKTCTLTSTQNIVDSGRLIAQPSSASVFHTIIIDSVNESKFIGGGMDVVYEDKGLWVRGAGTLELNGTAKTAWVNLNGEALHGATTIKLKIIPKGWRVGDQLSIAPTTPITDKAFYTGFDTVTITKISGSTVTFGTPLRYDHPVIKNPFKAVTYTAEVLNLTRNVRIEGKVNGRSHINIAMTSAKFNISYVEIKNMGVRNDSTGELGRYPLHFHHCGNGSAGSLVEGVVIRDCGNHAYVPHASYGITFRHCIAYNIMEAAYWWDTPPNDGYDPVNNSNDILFDSCISAIVKVGNSPYRLANFTLGSGLRNTTRNCIGIGNQGSAGSAPYIWPESSNYTDNLWTFENNISHNNRSNAVFGWQNDPHNHQINNFTAYNNGLNGIELGAYTNAYKFNDLDLIGHTNGIFLHANPRPKGTVDEFGYMIAWKRVRSTDPLYITIHTLPGNLSGMLFKDCKFPKVIVSELPKRVVGACPGRYDFVNCNLKYSDFDIRGMEAGSLIRVQNIDGYSFQINDQRIIEIIPVFFNK